MKKKIGMVVFVLIIINVLTVILLMIHKETTKVEKPDTASKQEMVKNEGKAYASHYQLQVSLDTQNKVDTFRVHQKGHNQNDFSVLGSPSGMKFPLLHYCEPALLFGLQQINRQ